MRGVDSRGFLVLEVLIAGLILTASIASAMYLFRIGFTNMERVNRVNLLSAKLLQAGNFFKIVEFERRAGTEDLGDGVIMKWKAQLIARNNTGASGTISHGEGFVGENPFHELFLYKVDLMMEYQGLLREYQIHVFRFRPLFWR
jgi:hypothetical protein